MQREETKAMTFFETMMHTAGIVMACHASLLDVEECATVVYRLSVC